MTSVSNWIYDKLAETGSTRPLGLFRFAIGALLYIRFGQELSLHASNSVAELIFSLAFFASALCVTIGLFTRYALVSATLLLAAMYYGKAWGWVYPGWGHHHHYLLMICCGVMVFSAAGRSFSADRILAIHFDRDVPNERAATWPQTLLVLQLAAIYFWAAVDKTSIGYLHGDWLERVLEWVYAGHPAYDIVTHRAFLVSGSWLVLIIEYLLPIALLLKWRLNFWIPVAMLLHAGFYVMLPVQTYSATMIVLYLLVVNPDILNAQLNAYFAPRHPAHG